MNENVINFDVDAFREKLKENGMSVQDAGVLVGKSKLYWYSHLKSGKVDRSVFFKFHELLRQKTMSGQDTNNQPCLEKSFPNRPIFDSFVKKQFSPSEAKIIDAAADKLVNGTLDSLKCSLTTKDVSLWLDSSYNVHILISPKNTIEHDLPKELVDDYRLLHKLGPDLINRLYHLAEYEKRRTRNENE